MGKPKKRNKLTNAIDVLEKEVEKEILQIDVYTVEQKTKIDAKKQIILKLRMLDEQDDNGKEET